jgi:hypothetical protein
MNACMLIYFHLFTDSYLLAQSFEVEGGANNVGGKEERRKVMKVNHEGKTRRKVTKVGFERRKE